MLEKSTSLETLKVTAPPLDFLPNGPMIPPNIFFFSAASLEGSNYFLFVYRVSAFSYLSVSKVDLIKLIKN